uniref:MYC binding protein n=1 Tax=Nothobranchius furzeri TaxID=105023 RepID=A0A8C6VUV5_NOTFU
FLLQKPDLEPSPPRRYVKQCLNAVGQNPDTDALQQELNKLRQEIARLTEENKDLRARLKHYETAPEDGSTTK